LSEPSAFFFDVDLSDLEDLLASWGEPRYRAEQIWRGLYKGLAADPSVISNLPAQLKKLLVEHFSFSHLEPHSTITSSDGETTKMLFALPDNLGIETVLMCYEKRRTLCISTQAGCALGCVFCATGQMGFKRHLSSGEIVEQVLYFARQLESRDEQVTNVVLMGMGEPFHNYEATLAAIDRLNHPAGFNLGARRFTISTVGLVPFIRRFANEGRQVNLAVSLHAAEDDLRSSMLPINRKYSISELLDACRDYVDRTHRRVTFEWALIHNINDSPEQARLLAARLRGLLCHVNVIPLNPTAGYDGHATTRERARAFREELVSRGVPCTIRIRRGIEIQAGCGQLAILKNSNSGENN
jgi:23S rRNA (adenine2503-C2)-methyltransferase